MQCNNLYSSSCSFTDLHCVFNDILSKFASLVFRCGVLTVEIEHVDVSTLEKLEQQGVDCQPKASTIRIIQVYLSSQNNVIILFGYVSKEEEAVIYLFIFGLHMCFLLFIMVLVFAHECMTIKFFTMQDKYLQKVHFSQHSIPLPDFMQVSDY